MTRQILMNAKKLSYFGMLCWGGRKAACSPCRLVKRLSKQVRVSCKCKLSFESDSAYFTWRQSGESRDDRCDQYQQISTESLPIKTTEAKMLQMKDGLQTAIPMYVSILTFVFLTLARNVSSDQNVEPDSFFMSFYCWTNNRATQNTQILSANDNKELWDRTSYIQSVITMIS